jgi:methylated-DNA-[protein]-cysteine S-methyltransferase
MTQGHTAYYESEIGPIEITGTEEGILSLDFLEEGSMDDYEVHPCLEECVQQLDEYFKGTRSEFSLNVILQGTAFQKNVWNQLMKIPFGETVTYKDLASRIGNTKAVRAVGNANGKNRIAIIVPCHRVIGSNGTLVGYASGVWRKEWLLKHESDVLSRS